MGGNNSKDNYQPGDWKKEIKQDHVHNIMTNLHNQYHASIDDTQYNVSMINLTNRRDKSEKHENKTSQKALTYRAQQYCEFLATGTIFEHDDIKSIGKYLINAGSLKWNDQDQQSQFSKFKTRNNLWFHCGA